MHITLTQVIAAVVNFFLLLVILRAFLYRPVLQMLEARKKEIEDNLNAAEKAKEEAQVLKADYEQSLKEAYQKAQSIVSEADQAAEKNRNDMLQKAREEANVIAARAKEEIEREKDQALVSLRQEVANLAIDAAEKVVGRVVSEEDHKAMVQDFVQEVGEAQ